MLILFLCLCAIAGVIAGFLGNACGKAMEQWLEVHFPNVEE